jgi:hypothetical protein
MNVFNRIRGGVSYSNVAATLAVVLGLSGTAYATGATEVLDGPGSKTVGFAGIVPAIPGNSSKYVFAGPTAQVSVDGDDRLTGSAAAPMGLMSGGLQAADVGLCFQRTVLRGQPAAPVTNFVGALFSAHVFTTARQTYSVSATRSGLAAGTYTVGMCVRNNGNGTINSNNFVNGWVMVTDES